MCRCIIALHLDLRLLTPRETIHNREGNHSRHDGEGGSHHDGGGGARSPILLPEVAYHEPEAAEHHHDDADVDEVVVVGEGELVESGGEPYEYLPKSEKRRG